MVATRDHLSFAKQIAREAITFFFQAEDGILDLYVTGVQTCALPICDRPAKNPRDVLEELDASAEGTAADHVECDIGIAVVDPLPAGAAGDHGKDDHAEPVHEA